MRIFDTGNSEIKWKLSDSKLWFHTRFFSMFDGENHQLNNFTHQKPQKKKSKGPNNPPQPPQEIRHYESPESPESHLSRDEKLAARGFGTLNSPWFQVVDTAKLFTAKFLQAPNPTFSIALSTWRRCIEIHPEAWSEDLENTIFPTNKPPGYLLVLAWKNDEVLVVVLGKYSEFTWKSTFNTTKIVLHTCT